MKRASSAHGGWGWGLGWGNGRRHRHRHGQPPWEGGPAGSSLNDCTPGTTCRIRRLLGGGAVRQRLLDLGIRPAREVTVLRNAPLNDPIELQVGDSFIALRRHEAAQIEVEHV